MRLVALIAPPRTASFEFHVWDWLPVAPRAEGLPLRPELERLKGRRILCFYGSRESDSLCPEAGNAGLAVAIPFEGGHHLGRRYDELAARIVAESER